MARSESISFQVHPLNEQSEINFMQAFHWNLLGTQEIKTVDNAQELRGDTVYNVKTTEHYVKLSFSRDLDTPHLPELKKLEVQYKALPGVAYPSMFPVAWWLWGIAALFYGIGIVAWIVYFFLLYQPKQKAAEALAKQNEQKRAEIMNEVAQLG